MCDLCKDIMTCNEFNDLGLFADGKHSRILYFPDKKEFVWYNECDDYFYSGVDIHNMKFCPCCGRRLTYEES